MIDFKKYKERCMIVLVFCIMTAVMLIAVQEKEILKWITILSVVSCMSIAFYIVLTINDDSI